MTIAQLFSGHDPVISTFIASMLPITELRGAIPIAITVWDLDPLTSYLAAVLGNLVPMFGILYLFNPIQKFLSQRSKLFERFFSWLYERTRNKLSEKYKKYGPLALMLFVAVPLPVTGVWTGSIAAWLFGIKKVPAVIFITLGAGIAGIIVTAITMGATIVF